MTSGKSLWANIKRQNYQKAWMWIVSSIVMIAFYPGTLLLYFNRLNSIYDLNADPQSIKMYVREMRGAVCDCLGIRESVIVLALAIMLGVGIYAYLNNKSKMDMLKSLPISTKKTFASDFTVGFLIFFVPYAVSVILSILIALAWGFMSKLALSEAILALCVNTVVFLLFYAITVICVTVSGNILVAIGLAFSIIVCGGYLLINALNNMRCCFFQTADNSFNNAVPFAFISPFMKIDDRLWMIKEMDDAAAEWSYICPSLAFWAVLVILLIVAAFILYIRRPVEAMNKSVSSKPVRIAIKLLIVPMFALIFGDGVNIVSSNNIKMLLLVVSITALILALAAEVVFEYDIKHALKSLWSTALAVIIPIIVIMIYKYDAFGYDRFLPAESPVESYAVFMSAPYGDIFEYAYNDEGELYLEYTDTVKYYEDNMFITDIDSINELASLTIEHVKEGTANNNEYDYNKMMRIPVLYRLRGGRLVARAIYADLTDAHTLDLLDKIVGSSEWKKGNFQFLSKRDVLDEEKANLSYSNGVYSTDISIRPSEMIEAWEKDMETFDFTKGNGDYPIGLVRITLGSFMGYTLPIYEDFARVGALLAAHDVDIKCEISADEVELIKITNYHNEVYEPDYYMNTYAAAVEETFKDPAVSKTITEKDKIAELLKISHPDTLQKFWDLNNVTRGNYDINVYFRYNPDNEFDSDYIYYCFTDDVPAWVEELTAMGR